MSYYIITYKMFIGRLFDIILFLDKIQDRFNFHNIKCVLSLDKKSFSKNYFASFATKISFLKGEKGM